MEEESGNEIIPLNEEIQMALSSETQIALPSEDENQRGVALPFPVNPSYAGSATASGKPKRYLRGKKGNRRQYVKFTPDKTPQEQLYISVKLPSSQVTLQVWKTNIIEHKCDVIINASNPQLQLLSAGVSGVIKQQDSRNGDVIQNAMKRFIQNNHDDFLSGDAVITTAGNLKNCRRIVHAVGPKWNNASQRNSDGALKACIFKSLEETDRVGLTSIAIPAISCGVFGGKVDVCVPLILDAVVEYFKEKKTTSIRRVDFVENQKQEVLNEFKRSVQKYQNPNTEIGDQQQATAPTPVPRVRSDAYSPNSASSNVKLLIADIASVQADVIVNITSAKGFPSMQGSSVAKALLRKAGSAIQQECAQTAGPHNVGSVFRTNGGGLSCQEIYHCILSHYNKNSEQIVKRIVSSCLKVADNAGYSSIAFPAVATGGFRHPAGKVAKWMMEEISSFLAMNMKVIIIVLYPQDTLTISIFQAEFSSVQLRPSTSKSGKDEKLGNEELDLFFYSSEVEEINRAYDALTLETRKMVHCQIVQGEVFGRLSEWELWELKEVAIANKVNILDKSNRYLNQLAIKGLMLDVMKAHEAVKDIAKEFCEAETAASFVTWQKSVHGAWEDYHPRSANILEKAYNIRNGNNTDPKLNKIIVPEYNNHKLRETTVDLSNLGNDLNGRNPTRVRRRVKQKAESEVIPSFWAPMHDHRCLKMPLQQGSQEYQTVHNKIRQTGGSFSVVKIERIQNVSLYKQYIAKKAEVTKKMTSGNLVERQLFHCTADDDRIIVHGFEQMYAGKNVYGRGVYFGVNASYLNNSRSTLPNSTRQHTMFLADVVTGDYCLGSSAYVAPPPRQSGIKNDVFDSVVDNVGAPNIFVIFKDASAYPTFLITYN